MRGDVDTNIKVLSDKVSFDKKNSRYFIDYRYAKKIDLYPHSFQKWKYIDEILIKLNA